MEHRLNSRLPVDIAANMYKGRVNLGSFFVKDISLEGLCVKSSDHQLHEGNFLEVRLPTGSRDLLAICNMSALVIWTKNGYAGLIWTNVNPEFAKYYNEISNDAA